MSIDEHSKRVRNEQNRETLRKMSDACEKTFKFKDSARNEAEFLQDLGLFLVSIGPLNRSARFKTRERKAVKHYDLVFLLDNLGVNPFSSQSWRSLRSKIENTLVAMDKDLTESGRREDAQNLFVSILSELSDWVIKTRDVAQPTTRTILNHLDNMKSKKWTCSDTREVSIRYFDELTRKRGPEGNKLHECSVIQHCRDERKCVLEDVKDYIKSIIPEPIVPDLILSPKTIRTFWDWIPVMQEIFENIKDESTLRDLNYTLRLRTEFVQRLSNFLKPENHCLNGAFWNICPKYPQKPKLQVFSWTKIFLSL